MNPHAVERSRCFGQVAHRARNRAENGPLRHVREPKDTADALGAPPGRQDHGTSVQPPIALGDIREGPPCRPERSFLVAPAAQADGALGPTQCKLPARGIGVRMCGS